MSAVESFITSAKTYMDASVFLDFAHAHNYPWSEIDAARQRWREAKQALIDQGTAITKHAKQRGVDVKPVYVVLAIVGRGGPQELEKQWSVIEADLRWIDYDDARQPSLPDLSDSMTRALDHLKTSRTPVTNRELATVAGAEQGTVRQWCMTNGPLWLFGVRNKGNKQGYHYDKSADLSKTKR